MDLIEVLQTLLEADRYLADAAANGHLEAETDMLANVETMAEQVYSYIHSVGISAPTFDYSAYRAALPVPESPSALAQWVYLIYQHISRQPRNMVDLDFVELGKHIAQSSHEALVDEMKRNFAKWQKSVSKEVSKAFIKFQMTWQFWGKFNPTVSIFDMLHQRADCLKNHWEDLETFYYALNDYRSRKVLLTLLQYWLELNPQKMDFEHETQFHTYFDLDLMPCTPDEVFVDLGAFIGDTVQHYLESYGPNCHEKIYCYEIIDDNIRMLKKNLATVRNLDVRAKGAGAKNGVMYLPEVISSNASRLQEKGNVAIPVVALDEDIQEPVTFIKMDIEGSEYDALLGAKRHIVEDRPKLAISLYHSNDDIWRIPKLIHELEPSYLFYLRYNSSGPEQLGGTLFPADYILLAVPGQTVD